MAEISKLIKKLKLASEEDLCEIELDLFALIYDKKDLSDVIEIFITLSNWVGFSLRDGVWTFYEYTSSQSIEKTKEFLLKQKWDELTNMYTLGIHDYHNEKYQDNYNYPEKWMEESEIIDDWIFKNEDSIYVFLKEIVIKNEQSFLL